jgi:ubiquinone/menaquinone biosynthesis C-methylase UbiE
MKPEDYWGKEYYIGEVASKYLEERVREKIWESEKNIIKNWIKNIPPSKLILDVPVGTGRFLEDYLEVGLNPYGIDISQDMLCEARKNIGKNLNSVNLQQGNAEDLPFPDASIDYIVCVRLFHLLPYSILKNVLSEFSRVCQNEVIIQVFSIRSRSLTGIAKRFLRTLSSHPVLTVSFLFQKIVLKLNLQNLSIFDSTDKKINEISNSIENQKTFCHEEKEIKKLFEDNNFYISRVIAVDESDSNPNWIMYPSCFYFLSKLKDES